MAFGKVTNKQKIFNISDNKRVAFFIFTFLFGIISMVLLYPKTMISVKNTMILSVLFLSIDIIVLKVKTKIKHLQTYVGLCLTILLAQLSLVLWINAIPLGTHVEKYKIISTRPFDKGEILQLENDAYSDFFFIRFQSIDIRYKNTITYYFNDGLLGFNVLEDTK